jgi:uncharacterized protein YggE
MKTITLTIFTLSFFFLISQSASADNQRLITVSGRASVNIPPDEFIIEMNILGQSSKLKNALQENKDRLSKLKSLIENLSIDNNDFRVSHIKINSRKNWSETRVKEYIVSRSVLLSLSDLETYNNFIEQAALLDIKDIAEIEFRSLNLRKYQDKARSDAVRAAFEKAQEMSSIVNQKVGKVYSITEIIPESINKCRKNYNLKPNPFNVYSDFELEQIYDDDLSPSGFTTVTASVIIQFELIDE